MLSNKSPINSLATPRHRELKSQDPSGFPTSIFASAAEELLAVRVQRLGTTGR
jgi:hypothetical protein